MSKQQMDRKEYLEERKLLVELEASAYRDFDRTLLTLSSGAIALSVAFIDKLQNMVFMNLLMFSWLTWCISLFLQLASLFLTPKAMREEQVILNEQYKAYSKDPRQNKYLGWSSDLNLGSVILFCLGTLSFIIFAILNIDCII